MVNVTTHKTILRHIVYSPKLNNAITNNRGTKLRRFCYFTQKHKLNNCLYLNQANITLQAELDAVTKATEPAITRVQQPTAQKAYQILLPPDMQQRPLSRPLQIALGYSHNIYFHVPIKTFDEMKNSKNMTQYCADYRVKFSVCSKKRMLKLLRLWE